MLSSTTRPSLGTSNAASRQQQRAGRSSSSLVVRASSSELRKPELSAKPASASTGPAPAPAQVATSSSTGVTVEYQRQQAKEMQKYFRRLSLEEEVAKAQVFGWTKKNEISNGRWVMFGLLVGMLTEYATGVSFIDQLKLMVSYLGIADIYD